VTFQDFADGKYKIGIQPRRDPHKRQTRLPKSIVLGSFDTKEEVEKAAAKLAKKFNFGIFKT